MEDGGLRIEDRGSKMEDRRWRVEGRVMARRAILDPRSSIFEVPYLPGRFDICAIAGGHAGLSELRRDLSGGERDSTDDLLGDPAGDRRESACRSHTD